MRSWFTRLFVCVACLVAVALSTPARAQGKGPVHVVNLDSDDATEDQAEGLTAALKSRLRATSGWQLAEVNDSLSMLIPALKCPPKPDAACLQRIADQLKTDRFFWGTVAKGPTPHQVTADLHLWVRGRPEQSAKESYSDNLKDPNDEALRKVSASLFERLTGDTTEGSVTIHSAVTNAQVFVDGAQRGVLDRGALTLSLPGGTHHVELRAQGYAAAGQQLNVITGSDSSVTLELAKTAASGQPEPPGKPVRVVRVLGFSAIGAGVVVGAIGVIEGVRFIGLQSDNQNDAAKYPTSVTDFCSDATKQKLGTSAPCDTRTAAEDARSMEFILLGTGAALIATGAVLLVFDRPAQEKSATALRVTPSFGTRGGGLSLGGSF